MEPPRLTSDRPLIAPDLAPVSAAADAAPAPSPIPLPARLLYATSARIGGTGLDLVANQGLKASVRGGFLGRAIAYRNRSADIPADRVRSLRFHPVRLISFLDRPYYYGAKKRYVDWIAAGELRGGAYDFFHGWSGDSHAALQAAHARGVPAVIEIPTWHYAHGFTRYTQTPPPPERFTARHLPRRWIDWLPITPSRLQHEYELADVLLTRSTRARETFLAEGFPEEKVYYLGVGADTERFQPGEPPPLFRALFVGALIKRKGIDLLLEAWQRLNLKDAELVLVGFVHDEIRPYLERFKRDNIRVIGATPRVEDYYRSATLQIFPSLCEGCAKTTCEAAACGLPQITTRESGDVVVDGYNGLTIPPNNLDALCAAIEKLYRRPELLAPMRLAARARAVEHFTWDSYRARLLEGYRRARKLKGV
jgi:glycosyltransferase involved in cell wall biosynthesis